MTASSCLYHRYETSRTNISPSWCDLPTWLRTQSERCGQDCHRPRHLQYCPGSHHHHTTCSGNRCGPHVGASDRESSCSFWMHRRGWRTMLCAQSALQGPYLACVSRFHKTDVSSVSLLTSPGSERFFQELTSSGLQVSTHHFQ